MTRETKIKLGLDVGDLISSAGRAKGAISSITDAMDKAEKESRWDDYGKLAYQKERLQSQNRGYEQNLKSLTINPKYQTTTANGATVLKMDSEFGQRLKDLNDNIKKLYAQHDEQMGNEKLKEAGDTFAQIDRLQGERNKLMKEANAPEANQSAKGIIKAIGIGQIANAINEGFSKWAGSLDRSGIINQYGSGDIMGGRIAEQKRQADLSGGIAQTLGGVLGSIIGTFVEPGGGTILGGTLGSAAGKALDTAFHIPISGESNEAAYAGLWQQRSADAMSLNALMGNDAVIGDRNMVREAFKEAANAAAKFGYSAEEGMDAMKKAAMQGLSKEDARKATEQVFDYERRTGADRGTLQSASLMASRYKTRNILSAGWAGVQASGMDKGQYGEFLRGMQKVIEDGISKGFVRSADEVATSFAMLAQMTNNNPLWQGENGARRLSDINAGLESATGLKSATDIRVFRAAKKIATDEGLGDSYWEAMKIMEAGLGGKYGTRLLHETMKLNMAAEGGGIKDVGESVRQQFGFNYTLTDEFLKDWLPYKDKDSKDFASLWESHKAKYMNAPLPDASSPELEAAKISEEVRNIYTQIGQIKFGDYHGKLLEEVKKANELLGAVKGNSVPNPPVSVGAAADAVRKAEALVHPGMQTASERLNLNSAKQALADAMDRKEEIDSVLGKLFSPGLLPYGMKSAAQKNDYDARDKIRETINKALYSEDESQMAVDFLTMFKDIPRNISKSWDEKNTFNSYAGNDMGQLLTALQKLTDKTDELLQATKENGKVNVEVEYQR